MDRVEPPLGKPAPPRSFYSRASFLPRRFRTVLVEPTDVEDLLPELLERRIGLKVRVDELEPISRDGPGAMHQFTVGR